MNNISEYSAIVIIVIFLIKEVFGFLKAKKNGNGNGNNKAILIELQKMNENHLDDISEQIQFGNEKIVEAINNGNMKIVESLGEIKGKLSK